MSNCVENIDICVYNIIEGYWITKLIAFVVIWAVLYAIIAAVQFIIAYWIWFAIGAAMLIIADIAFVIWRHQRHSSAGTVPPEATTHETSSVDSF